jgi:hypothetical protein
MRVVNQPLWIIARVYPPGRGCRKQVIERWLAAFLPPKLDVLWILHGETVLDCYITRIRIVIHLIAGFKDGGNDVVVTGKHDKEKHEHAEHPVG